jgi:hypothetical protein
VTFAHVAGAPVEELLPLALASGGLLAGALRHQAAHAVRRARRRLGHGTRTPP